MDKETLQKTNDMFFGYLPLPVEEQAKLDEIRRRFKELGEWLIENAPPSDDVLIALRKLRVAAMHSSIALAHNFRTKGSSNE